MKQRMDFVKGPSDQQGQTSGAYVDVAVAFGSWLRRQPARLKRRAARLFHSWSVMLVDAMFSLRNGLIQVLSLVYLVLLWPMDRILVAVYRPGTAFPASGTTVYTHEESLSLNALREMFRNGESIAVAPQFSAVTRKDSVEPFLRALPPLGHSQHVTSSTFPVRAPSSPARSIRSTPSIADGRIRVSDNNVQKVTKTRFLALRRSQK